MEERVHRLVSSRWTEWKHGLWIIRNAIVRQHGLDAWAAIAAEVRKLRPAMAE